MNIRNVVTLCTLILAAVVSISTHAQDSRMYIDGRSAADANVPPYSGAVLIGDTLHLAGSIGLDENLEVTLALKLDWKKDYRLGIELDHRGYYNLISL